MCVALAVHLVPEVGNGVKVGMVSIAPMAPRSSDPTRIAIIMHKRVLCGPGEGTWSPEARQIVPQSYVELDLYKLEAHFNTMATTE